MTSPVSPLKRLVGTLPPLSRWQIAGLVGSLTASLVLSPLPYARFAEYLVHFRTSPLRAASSLAVALASFGTIGLEVLGLSPLKALLPTLSAKSRIGILAPFAALSAFSLSRGMSPKHKTLVDMTGKTALITGGTSGIGLVVARQLAVQGANIALVVRDEAKGDSLRNELIRINPRILVHVLVAQQTDLRAVGTLPIDKSLQIFENGIDVLILNAGTFPSGSATFGASEMETGITSMHFSHALITKMCWNLLNANAKVVITSSIAHDKCPSVDTVFEGIHQHSPEASTSKVNSSGYARYARAKFANALFARQLGRIANNDARGIVVSAHHPGAVATKLWNGDGDPGVAVIAINWFICKLMRSAEHGAATLVDAAMGSEPLVGQETAPNGSYYISSTLVDHGFRFNPLLHSSRAAESLWDRTDAIIASYAPPAASWTFKGGP